MTDALPDLDALAAACELVIATSEGGDTMRQSFAIDAFDHLASPDVVLRLVGEIRRLREALAFYADSDTYEQVDLLGLCPLSDDADNGLFGKRARQALGAP